MDFSFSKRGNVLLTEYRYSYLFALNNDLHFCDQKISYMFLVTPRNNRSNSIEYSSSNIDITPIAGDK